MNLPRRAFLKSTAACALVGDLHTAGGAAPSGDPSLAGELGITTGSFMKHLSVEPTPGKLVLLDLPRILRDELDLKVIDLMTRTLASMEPAYLDDFRSRAEKYGRIITNLKMNQTGIDMASPDPTARRAALDEYRRTIDSAHRLGCRWVRPAPQPKRPDLQLLAAGYRELIDYAAPKGISLLVENNAWLSDDPDAIPSVIETVGPGIAAAPDTGNWTDRARYDGLAKAFPLAVTCDFKAMQLGPNGEHPPQGGLPRTVVLRAL
jgi:sugar phosphate isomerase/epimerase